MCLLALGSFYQHDSRNDEEDGEESEDKDAAKKLE